MTASALPSGPDTAAALAGRPVPRMLLTVQEFAAVLRCGQTRAKEVLKAGIVPSVMVAGTMRRIRLSDLAEYLDSLAPSLPGAGELDDPAGPGERAGRVPRGGV